MQFNKRQKIALYDIPLDSYVKKFDKLETPAIRWLNDVHTGIRTVVASSTQCISLDIRNFYPIST
jgi:uncharacterized membrane protein